MKIGSKITRAYEKLNEICNIGIENESSEPGQKHVVAINTLSLIFFAANAFIGVSMFFFTSNQLPAILFFLTGLIFLFPIYLNSAGFLLFARIFMVLFANNAFLLFVCSFSYDIRLNNYFLIILISSNCAFVYHQKKWLISSLLISAVYYIISCFVQDYVSANYQLKNNDISGIILIAGNALLIIACTLSFIHISRRHEIQFTKKQTELQLVMNLIEAQNDDLKAFSAAASHSLQTPIYISKYFLDKLKNISESSFQTKVFYKNIKIIDDSLLLMDQIIASLFSYNHILHIEQQQMDFNVVAEIADIKKRMTEKYPGCRIFSVIEDFSITTNKILFAIILQNLVDNGLKYNRSAKPTISINTKQNQNNLSFLITDNGIGIDEKNFEKIFEPFVRINTNGEFSGNGLGLSGARRAAERIGGKLFCLQSSAAGSVFQFDLPINFIKPQNNTLPETIEFFQVSNANCG